MTYTPTKKVSVKDDILEINDFYYERGWSDGLPIIPPTQDRVEEMFRYTNYDPEEVLAYIPPRKGAATLEKVAINAVMAGCKPTCIPVIISALQAMCRPEFNLLGLQATTHPAAPLIILNGPVRKVLDINCGAGVFGPGWRSNATIGRALRLILINVGGGIPGVGDKATMGHPGKYTYCIGENEEVSPWEPLHVEKGFSAMESTITVVACESPHNVNDHYSSTGEGILTQAAGTLSQVGCNDSWYKSEPVLVLCPEHASTIFNSCRFQKKQVKEFIAEKGKTLLSRWSPENIKGRFRDTWPEIYGEADPNSTMVPILKDPNDLIVIVAGGFGKHSMVIPTIGICRPVTTHIVNKKGDIVFTA